MREHQHPLGWIRLLSATQQAKLFIVQGASTLERGIIRFKPVQRNSEMLNRREDESFRFSRIGTGSNELSMQPGGVLAQGVEDIPRLRVDSIRPLGHTLVFYFPA